MIADAEVEEVVTRMLPLMVNEDLTARDKLRELHFVIS